MNRRLRVSLLARMAVSVCILATVALAVGSVVALLGGMLGLGLRGGCETPFSARRASRAWPLS